MWLNDIFTEQIYKRGGLLWCKGCFSCKFSETAEGLSDITGVYKFANMRAYLLWAVRDWLNPVNDHNPCLPLCDELTEECTEIKWKFQSTGSIIIEPKDEIKKRLRRSTDYTDALANTFYPHDTMTPSMKGCRILVGCFSRPRLIVYIYTKGTV